MTDGIGQGIGAGPERGRLRGHVKLGLRMWARIAREYAAGASAGWLSARYGPGERTIAARARKEGWRRKDLAEAADAALEAAEARGELAAPAAPAIGPGLWLGPEPGFGPDPERVPGRLPGLAVAARPQGRADTKHCTPTC